MSDLISRQDALDAFGLSEKTRKYGGDHSGYDTRMLYEIQGVLEGLPSAQPERLTDDDFETIRIHLNAYKEKLCNQRRWEEAEEYQRIIDRFMAFASAQPECIQNNAVHLCDSCQYTYVTCPSHGNDAVFGDGKGNDNICACNKYRPISAQPENIRCKDCKHSRKWRSEESAKKFGQIYGCARNVFDCPKPEDFCSHAERRTNAFD